MKTIQIEILEPKAQKLLHELENLKLIRICPADADENTLSQLLKDFRQNAPALTPAEITAEVEGVRKKRYARQA